MDWGGGLEHAVWTLHPACGGRRGAGCSANPAAVPLQPRLRLVGRGCFWDNEPFVRGMSGRFGAADVDRCGGMPVDIDATFCLVQSLAFQSKDACSSLLLSRATQQFARLAWMPHRDVGGPQVLNGVWQFASSQQTQRQYDDGSGRHAGGTPVKKQGRR